jgi:hypothetical protein
LSHWVPACSPTEEVALSVEAAQTVRQRTYFRIDTESTKACNLHVFQRSSVEGIVPPLPQAIYGINNFISKTALHPLK